MLIGKMVCNFSSVVWNHIYSMQYLNGVQTNCCLDWVSAQSPAGVSPSLAFASFYHQVLLWGNFHQFFSTGAWWPSSTWVPQSEALVWPWPYYCFLFCLGVLMSLEVLLLSWCLLLLSHAVLDHVLKMCGFCPPVLGTAVYFSVPAPSPRHRQDLSVTDLPVIPSICPHPVLGYVSAVLSLPASHLSCFKQMLSLIWTY